MVCTCVGNIKEIDTMRLEKHIMRRELTLVVSNASKVLGLMLSVVRIGFTCVLAAARTEILTSLMVMLGTKMRWRTKLGEVRA